MDTFQKYSPQLKDAQIQLVNFTHKHFLDENSVIAVENAKSGEGIDAVIRIKITNDEQDAHTFMRNTNRIQAFLLALATKFTVAMKTIRVLINETETSFHFTI